MRPTPWQRIVPDSQTTATDSFLARARRALRRSPRYLASRALSSVQQRARKPWASVAPRLFNDAALLRETGAPSIDELWDRLKRRPFFFSPAMRGEWTAAFERRCPDARVSIVRTADAVLRHEFDLLGSGAVSLGARLPWHTDFKTGREWPLEYACEMQYAELDRPTDVKVPWELSRCQHFTSLGQAYWLTGDDRYAREFVAEVDDWIDRNPWAFGVNWACAMDIALRAVSWLWAFHFFADAAPCASRRFRSRMLRSLFLHGSYIATHLEKGDVNGNHYLCDGVGLVFLGIFFGDTAKSHGWLDLGRSIVGDEIERQTTQECFLVDQIGCLNATDIAFHQPIELVAGKRRMRLSGEFASEGWRGLLRRWFRLPLPPRTPRLPARTGRLDDRGGHWSCRQLRRTRARIGHSLAADRRARARPQDLTDREAYHALRARTHP